MKAEYFNRKAFELLYKKFGPQKWWDDTDPLEVAFGAILAQRTVWKNAEKSVRALKSSGLLSPEAILKADVLKIAPLIKPSGFPRSKAIKLKAFSQFILNELSGDLTSLRKIPVKSARDMLLKVKGIGPETADSILCYALRMPVLVVDAYTFRIYMRHNLTGENTSYEELQEIASSGLPGKWETLAEYHALLVKTAKEHCRKKEPECEKCPLREMLE